MTKFFSQTFANSGTKTAIPDTADPSGYVSYPIGWGADYERNPIVDPLAKPIERAKMNELFFDITSAIQQLQSFGTPFFITSADNDGVAYSYPKYARVLYSNGHVYESLVDSNTDLPTVKASWNLVDASSYSNSLGNFGYQKLPGGFIMQWGTFSVAGSTTTTFSFPISFVVGAYALTASFSVPGLSTVNIDRVSASQYRVQNTYSATQAGYWIAFGQ